MTCSSPVLDPHNYARYRGDIIGASDSPVSTTFFGEFWGTIASRYMNNPLVVFGIMNEVCAQTQAFTVQSA